MSISSISSNAGVPQGWQSPFQQARRDFGQLAQALQAGDLAGAQKAYADLQSLQQNNQSGTNSAASANSSADPIQNDFQALGQALASGDLTQAQTDFAQLQNDVKSALQKEGGFPGLGAAHRGHHHHHHPEVQDQSSSTSITNPADGTGSDSSNAGSAGAGINLIA